MSELPSTPDALPVVPVVPAAPRLSAGQRMSAALERTMRADGPFLVFLTLISLGLGVFCAARWEKAEWRATATLRVAGQTLEGHSDGSIGANLLVSRVFDDLRTPEKLEAMNTALGLAWTAEEWEKEWNRVVISMGANASLQWTAQDKQTALLAVELICQQVKSIAGPLAKELHHQALLECSNRIAKVDARLAEGQKTQQEFLAKNKITDVKGDLAALNDVITSTEYQLRLASQEEVAAKEQYKEVSRQLEDMKRDAAVATQRDSEEKAQQIPEKEQIKRRQILRDAIQALKDQLEQKALIENKVNEKKQLEALAAQGKASQEGVLRLETEIQVLKTKMAGNRKILDLENELKMLDQTASPNQGKKMPSSPIITALLDKKMDREMKMLGVARQKEYLHAELEAAKSRRDFLQTAVERKDREYLQESDRLIKEKGHLESRRDQAAMDGPQRALQVEWIQTPSVAEQPISTNRYQLFSSVFLSFSLLGFLSIYGWELRK